MSTKLWYLSRIRIFAGMTAEEMQQIEQMTEMTTTPKFAPIYLPGDASDGVYMLKKGQVRISRLYENGKQVVLSILGPGDIFGELAIAEEGVRQEIAEAMEETMLCAIRRQDFEQILRHSPDVHIRVTKLIGLRLSRVHSHVEDLVFRSASARLASLLLRLADEHGAPAPTGIRLKIRLTQQDLANLLGLTRQTVSETISEWKRDGCVLADGSHLILCRPEQLRSLASN